MRSAAKNILFNAVFYNELMTNEHDLMADSTSYIDVIF